jgi:hypothetical protein
MKNLVLATAALSIAAIAPASAQMMGDPMMPMGEQSCVMNGQFVPCPPMGGMQYGMMQPGMMNQGAGISGGMMMEEPDMERPMTARERRQQQRMMRQQSM